MFEALESGKFLDGAEYDRRELPLRDRLLKCQFALAERCLPVIVVVAGVDGAGKGRLVHRLNVWMDPRGIETNALWMHSDEEESRPWFWRYWRTLPPRGEIGIFLGSWYKRALQEAFEDRAEPDRQAHYIQQINDFERLLSADGYLIVKLWLHVTRETQRLQLKEEAPRKQQNPRVDADARAWWKAYPRVMQCAQEIARRTDTGHAPWHLLEADDRLYREITAGEILARAMEERLQQPACAPREEVLDTPGPTAPRPRQPTLLDKVDSSAALSRDKYRRKLDKFQGRLQDLAWQAHRQRRSLVAVFEGWDAAGKGSAIRRVTGAIDPRLYHLVQYAAPTDEERAHHYLWRFWRNLQRDGRATLFDRSWYGRVLVERVEQLATPGEWQRAYNEINHFEEQLVEHGSVLAKFWIHITEEEQLRRFQEREATPHKQHKITPEDWRNRERWHDYELAVEDMVAHTSTRRAPWTLVAGNSKYYARIQILKTLCKALEAAL
jgi:AMP-polyphosphate phosphotransferase